MLNPSYSSHKVSGLEVLMDPCLFPLLQAANSKKADLSCAGLAGPKSVASFRCYACNSGQCPTKLLGCSTPVAPATFN